jgi:stage II sporulation protein D
MPDPSARPNRDVRSNPPTELKSRDAERRTTLPARVPFVVIPRAKGGRERRFAVHPSRVFFVLFSIFVLGLMLATVGFTGYWVLTDQTLVREDYGRLAERVDELQDELDELKARSRATLNEPGVAARSDSENDSALAGLKLPPRSDKPPTIRIALLRTSGSITLEGEGLNINQGPNQAIPMPRGRALVTARKNGVWVEGVGILERGTPIQNRLGPIRIGKKEYPGILELHEENGRLLLVNEVGLERYLQGVVSSELPASWGLEAKKAQAVAARTYALMQKASGTKSYDLESTVDDQVYSGRSADASSRAAVTTTHGEVLSRNGYLVSAFYHSACAGQTEVPANVWPERPANGNASVKCNFCKEATRKAWAADISPEELLEALDADGEKATQVTGLHIRERSLAGRVTLLDLITDHGAVSWSGNRFRELMGWNRVRSASFESKVVGNGFLISGHGAGHGVGLCQWGARKMASEDYDYQDILGHYYPGAGLTRIY